MHELLNRFKPDLVFVYETHITFARTKNFWDREAYSLVAMEEAQGHSGGIWVMKSSGSVYAIIVRDTMHQAITINISRGQHTWACTAVYASPVYSLRCHLWDHLAMIRTTMGVPWALIGDFNDVLLPSEQRGEFFLEPERTCSLGEWIVLIC